MELAFSYVIRNTEVAITRKNVHLTAVLLKFINSLNLPARFISVITGFSDWYMIVMAVSKKPNTILAAVKMAVRNDSLNIPA